MLENQPRTQKRDKFNLPVGQFNPATIKSVSKMEITSVFEKWSWDKRITVSIESTVSFFARVAWSGNHGTHAVTKKAGSCISMLVETSWLVNWNSQIRTLISNWFDMVLFFLINRKLIVCRTFNLVIFWRLQIFWKYLVN